jgi:hypothetical protein
MEFDKYGPLRRKNSIAVINIAPIIKTRLFRNLLCKLKTSAHV